LKYSYFLKNTYHLGKLGNVILCDTIMFLRELKLLPLEIKKEYEM